MVVPIVWCISGRTIISIANLVLDVSQATVHGHVMSLQGRLRRRRNRGAHVPNALVATRVLTTHASAVLLDGAIDAGTGVAQDAPGTPAKHVSVAVSIHWRAAVELQSSTFWTGVLRALRVVALLVNDMVAITVPGAPVAAPVPLTLRSIHAVAVHDELILHEHLFPKMQCGVIIIIIIIIVVVLVVLVVIVVDLFTLRNNGIIIIITVPTNDRLARRLGRGSLLSAAIHTHPDPPAALASDVPAPVLLVFIIVLTESGAALVIYVIIVVIVACAAHRDNGLLVVVHLNLVIVEDNTRGLSAQ